MYEKILLAYDGTAHSTAALHQSAALARLCEAELHLLGIVAITGGGAMAQAYGPSDLFAMEREHLERALDSAALDLGSQSLTVDTTVREGSPADEIAAHAHHIGADLAVLGHSDKGLLARWFEGSTGARLVGNLPCSLLIATES